MSAPPYMNPGCSRRLEIHHANFAVATYFFSAAEIGELFQMLMAETGEQPVPAASSELIASAFAERRTYSRIKGSFGRINLSLAVRTAVFERDRAACRYCGIALTWDLYECDHVHPVSKGGSSDPKNLAAACEPCNRSKGAKTLAEWLAAK